MSLEANNNNFKTADEYIQLQPTERRVPLLELRQIILKNLPKGFEEIIQYGMIVYVVPFSIYPSGYHVNPKDPLPFLALGNQKGYIAIYHFGIYTDPELLKWFVQSYEKLNLGKLDMGKSCIRLKKMNNIPYDLIGELCSKISVEAFIDLYEGSLKNRSKGKTDSH